MIDVSDNICKNAANFIRKSFELSVPKKVGPIPESYVEHFLRNFLTKIALNKETMNKDGLVLDIDYALGYPINMKVYKQGEKFVIDDIWPGHTEAQLQQLIEETKPSIF